MIVNNSDIKKMESVIDCATFCVFFFYFLYNVFLSLVVSSTTKFFNFK
jgi:hypothetical protein